MNMFCRNLNTGECVGTYHGHTGSVNCIRFHHDKHLALTVSGDMSAHIWSYECGRTTSSDEDVLDKEDCHEGKFVIFIRNNFSFVCLEQVYC